VTDSKPARLVALGGSLKPLSRSLTALKVAVAGAEEAGARTELFDVRSLDLPFYTPEVEPPEVARSLAEAVHHAEGLLWSSPMYHGTISGSFKNALDWLQLLARRDPPFLTTRWSG
jgi:FMN reductase